MKTFYHKFIVKSMPRIKNMLNTSTSSDYMLFIKFFVSDLYRTIQKPLKFDTKEFENRLKIAILKNATLELGEDIGFWNFAESADVFDLSQDLFCHVLVVVVGGERGLAGESAADIDLDIVNIVGHLRRCGGQHGDECEYKCGFLHGITVLWFWPKFRQR